MSSLSVAAHRPRTRNGFILLSVALFALSVLLQYAGAMAPQRVLGAEGCDSFAIFTTDAAGDANNKNHYESKPEVYLNGGPTSAGGGLAAGTVIYYQVREPDGTPLMEIRSTVVGADGTFRVQLYPFDTTSNNGNEYKVVASTEADLSQGGCTKSDNFKVDGPGAIKITKDVDGGPSGFSGAFPITVDCGAAGTFHATIQFPDPGFVVIDGIDAKAECHVSEGTLPDAPDGFEWGDPTFHGNDVTIESTKTVTVGITNHLTEVAAPALTVDKGVSLSADGPFTANLDTTVGTTVHYRITITNTGNVGLTGVTLTDNTFNLVAEGCTIPTTLAVGAHFDCDYDAVAALGTTTNIATGDSAETGSDTGTATVVATPAAAPALTVDKGVSLSADGPFTANLDTTVGTTVHYRITITNTGNVGLTGVTLTDNTFNLVTEGCTIPTTLAVGAHFDCDYDAVAALGTTTNIATGDSAETGSDTGTATVVATPVGVVSLTIDKTNDAPELDGRPTVAEGDTVTFTLAYSVTGTAHNATIVDTLPAGLTYVTGSASSGTFVFQGYDATARTLTWTAASVAAGGSVTYQATVDAGATGIPQPLTNVAAIDSDDTVEDTDDSVVYVATPVLGETFTPGGETAPPTDVAGVGSDTQTGLSFPLLLGLLTALTGVILLVTPAPSSLKGRGRRD